jgi:tyrosinase
MAGIRENVITSQTARDNFLRGVVLLDQEMPGITTGDVFQFLQGNLPSLEMRGINQELSTYDLFVLWHVVAMNITLPPGNAAHSAPIFLPWHRMFLIRLEEQLQRVLLNQGVILNNDDFGLPYWDWAADGELLVSDQSQTQLWSGDSLGESQGSVLTGRLADVRVRLWQDPMTGILWSITPRPIEGQAGTDTNFPALPRRSDVTDALQESRYDQPPWSANAIGGHRNRLEGWLSGPQLHNLVHVWMGGDMVVSASPNDPVFFLHHCNVDRIWEVWMGDTHDPIYEPGAGEEEPIGHRINDLMIAILGEPLRPQDVLDPAQWYSYDSLSVD